MRIRYIVPIQSALIIPDHWAIPIQGGTCRVIEEAGLAKALEIIFTNQPIGYAPHIEKQAENRTQVSVRDPLWFFVKQQLDGAMAFLHCFHDITLATEEVETKYEGETVDEEKQIAVKSMARTAKDSPIPLSFDLLTRAIMAAEENSTPKFEATLARAASKALSEQQFINSFRYSFLLIESLYGEGQFKSSRLKEVLKNNVIFKEMVETTLLDPVVMRPQYTSDTAILFASAPGADKVIDHLVEKRGFYFHGNIKRKDAWRPEQQQVAEALAMFAISIVLLITREASTPMFDESFAKQHYENAKEKGAIIVFQIKVTYRDSVSDFQGSHQLDVNMPGTKATSRMALDVAKLFLEKFEYDQPLARLERAECTVQGSAEKVFDIQFHTQK